MKDLIHKEIDKHWSKVHKVTTERIKKSLKHDFTIMIITYITEYLAYVFVGIKAILGIISIGKLTLYVGALNLLSTSLRHLFSGYIQLGVMCTYLKNYTTFLEIKNEKYEGTLPIEKGWIMNMSLNSEMYPSVILIMKK